MQVNHPQRREVRSIAALGLLLLALIACPCATFAAAQKVESSSSSAAKQAAQELPQDPGAWGRIEGQVADPSGALIPGAHVLLRLHERPRTKEVIADKQGEFVFQEVISGQYSYTVTAPGFESFESLPFTLAPGESRKLDPATLAIPAHHADASVTISRKEAAAAELQTEQQQRIAGFPDFYTSFTWNAVPLDARQKFSLGLHATTDRMAFVTAGLVSSAEQIHGTFPGYGGGPGGFGKRFGAAYADGFIGKTLGAAIFPSLLRQDPRYFYMGPARPLKERVRHAVLSGFLTRGDNGHQQPNFSHIFGNASAGALSSLYHPASDSAGKLALDNALLGTLGEAGVNLARELLLRRFVHGGDAGANGIPHSANPQGSRTIQ